MALTPLHFKDYRNNEAITSYDSVTVINVHFMTVDRVVGFVFFFFYKYLCALFELLFLDRYWQRTLNDKAVTQIEDSSLRPDMCR